MASSSVYSGLLVFFPQVDTRILRAVAIENPKDVNKAVEVVLMEVIPNIASTSGSANDALDKSRCEEKSVRPVSKSNCEAVGFKVSSCNDTNSNGHPVCKSDRVQSSAVPEPSQSRYVTSTIWDSEDVPSNLESLVENNLDQLCSNFNSLNVDTSSEVSPLAVLDCPSHASEDGLQHANAEVAGETEICKTVSVNSIIITEVVDCENESEDDKSNDVLVSFDHESMEDSFTTGLDENEDDHLSSQVSRSGEICRIDLLEDIITDARDNKKTLFSAMESVINSMREVEVREKEVEEVKEEAARGPLSILASVEDLKQMLRHAREANDMHAGEVYGEKAILATEAKELQSRLLCLSDERDKSLAILDEMRKTLEQRLDAAAKEMKQAEQEKTEKEELARNALAEQQQIMDNLVQESKILKQEAEENSKLQEFLMDRGRVVDTLQGEISVIFQDINLLKQKFDNRVPLSDSISSSQTSCRLASSSSSVKNFALDQVSKRTSPTPSISDRLSSGEEREANDLDALVEDDGWEVCDKDLNM